MYCVKTNGRWVYLEVRRSQVHLAKGEGDEQCEGCGEPLIADAAWQVDRVNGAAVTCGHCGARFPATYWKE